jgi:hypothetical protein
MRFLYAVMFEDPFCEVDATSHVGQGDEERHSQRLPLGVRMGHAQMWVLIGPSRSLGFADAVASARAPGIARS